MSSILVKIFATALTLSQVTVQPDAVKTAFDRDRDKGEVVRLLKEGCTHFRRAFDIEDIDLDGLIATAMEDPKAVAGDTKLLQGISFGDLHVSYRLFCKGEAVAPPVDLGEVIEFYNRAVADLPDHTKVGRRSLPGISVILDGRGARFTEVFQPDHRRVWVPLSAVSEAAQKALIAAEDKRFYQHRGIDERGVIRAFIGNLAQPGRPQGGSTITQQVAKTLLVGDDLTYERKIREMIVAARMEQTFSKAEILELYLNAIYLGRSSWGIEMAARSYFGKSASALTVAEGALLAGLAKGPNYYDPDRQPVRARERLGYVLTRMREDGVITEEQVRQALAALPPRIAFARAGPGAGLHFIDHLNRDARMLAGLESLTASSYTVRSTINAALQEAAETALQEGLARYELSVGRQRFAGAEANLADVVARLEAASGERGAAPAWRRALETARLPLYDVHWPAAIVVDHGRAGLRVGLKDGRILPLVIRGADARRTLKLYDVVRVRVFDGPGKTGGRAELRSPPAVQGAAVVIENKTGRILAMTGGFSYPLSQLNRVTQAHRQPGSAFKPVVYAAALGHGLQPNTLIWDTPVTLPPVGGGNARSRAKDFWTPKNYDGGSAGLLTLRRALENSKNLVTARLLDGGISSGPEDSLDSVCALALEAQLYVECVRHYPFVLGAQPLRVLDLAAFYAAIANEGARPSPYAVETIEEAGRVVYRRQPAAPARIAAADRPAFFQLRTILQGVVERGTARSIRRYAPYVAGKTGTTDNENDAWFAGFTNDVTIVVWVGYDNADGKRRTLGRGQTGSKVALPIFESILESAWLHHAPRAPLAPPSPEAARQLVAMSIDLNSGEPIAAGQGRGFTEWFRRDGTGQLAQTQYRLIAREDVYAMRRPDDWSDGETAGGWRGERDPSEQGPAWRMPRRAWQSPIEPPWWAQGYDPPRRQRRVDPEYFWGMERTY